MSSSDMDHQFEMANRQLTVYTRKKAKEVAEEFTEKVEEVHQRFSIEPIPVTLLTWVMNFLTDLNIEFKLVTGQKMLREAKDLIRKQTKRTRKMKQQATRKKTEETDVT